MTGKNSPGPRFCFRIHAIGHRILHLPIAMRRHPYIQKLMDSVSPLEIFSCSSIEEARKGFYNLRMKFDFPYWAALHFKIRDISSGKVVPLILNRHQRWLTERFFDPQLPNPSRKYLISKTVPRCGLTTLIQAYISWSQTRFKTNSITYVASSTIKKYLMDNICHTFGGKNSSYGVSINDSVCHALFHEAYIQDTFSNVPCAFIHLSDMSEWLDPGGERSSEILSAAMKAWYKTPTSCIILEGDRTLHPDFRILDHQNPYIPQSIRLMNIGNYCRNAFFMNEVVKADSPKFFTDFLHIDLDQAH